MRLADADQWFEPKFDRQNEWVEMPGDAPGLNPDGDEPAQPDKPEYKPVNWVYLNGQVAFGDHHWDVARQLALQLGMENHVDYIPNLIARGQLPYEHNVAVGTMMGKQPQIWMSNVDRNAVFDAVREANDDH